MNDNADMPIEDDGPIEVNPTNTLRDDPIFERRSANLDLMPSFLEVFWGGGWELRPGHMTRTFQTRPAADEPPTDSEYRVDIHGFDGDLTELFLILQRFKSAIEGDVFNILSKLAEWTEKGTPYIYFTIDLGGEEEFVGQVAAVVTKVR
jgi:hypothetical protein